MQQNQSLRAWATGIVVLAAVVQLATWWLLYDDSTFARNGPGARAIRDMFGKDASPGGVAGTLGNIVQLAVLIVLALLAASPSNTQPRRRTSHRSSKTENPFA